MAGGVEIEVPIVVLLTGLRVRVPIMKLNGKSCFSILEKQEWYQWRSTLEANAR